MICLGYGCITCPAPKSKRAMLSSIRCQTDHIPEFGPSKAEKEIQDFDGLDWCSHRRLVCYFFAHLSIQNFFMGPTCEVQLKWKLRSFKDLSICVIGLQDFFNLGFYLTSYG